MTRFSPTSNGSLCGESAEQSNSRVKISTYLRKFALCGPNNKMAKNGNQSSYAGEANLQLQNHMFRFVLDSCINTEHKKWTKVVVVGVKEKLRSRCFVEIKRKWLIRKN